MAELWCKTSRVPGSWESLQTFLGGYVGNEMPLLPLSFHFFFFFKSHLLGQNTRSPHSQESCAPWGLCQVLPPGRGSNLTAETSSQNPAPESTQGQAGSTWLLHSTRGLVQSCRTSWICRGLRTSRGTPQLHAALLLHPQAN